MVRGGDALGVGGGGAIIEVGGVTMSHLSAGAESDLRIIRGVNININITLIIFLSAHLLLLLGPGGSDTDHPDQQHQEDQEDDGSGDSWKSKL